MENPLKLHAHVSHTSRNTQHIFDADIAWKKIGRFDRELHTCDKCSRCLFMELVFIPVNCCIAKNDKSDETNNVKSIKKNTTFLRGILRQYENTTWKMLYGLRTKSDFRTFVKCTFHCFAINDSTSIIYHSLFLFVHNSKSRMPWHSSRFPMRHANVLCYVSNGFAFRFQWTNKYHIRWWFRRSWCFEKALPCGITSNTIPFIMFCVVLRFPLACSFFLPYARNVNVKGNELSYGYGIRVFALWWWWWCWCYCVAIDFSLTCQ